MQKIENYVMLNGIEMTVKPALPNLLFQQEGASHWNCTVMCRGRQAEFLYSTTSDKQPVVEQVLSVIGSESKMCDDAPSFYLWAIDIGYDLNPVTRAKYDLVRKNRNELRRLLGNALYRELTENVKLD